MQRKGIRNAILNASCGTGGSISNSPYQQNTMPQLFGRATQLFYQKQMPFSSNRVIADVQGLDYDNFYNYSKRYIRTSDIQVATAGNNLNSDWQYVMLEDSNASFLPRGAKIRFNGNTWLVVNPLNIQGLKACGIMTRCTSTWNYYGSDGLIHKEPFHFGNGGNNLGSDNFVGHNSILIDGYLHSYIQWNDETKALEHNTRMIVGNQAYMVQGLQNGYQEFTDDENSVHLMHFDLHLTEVLDMDDMPNRIAGGLADSGKAVDTSSTTGKRIALKTQMPQYLQTYSTTIVQFGLFNGDVEDHDTALRLLVSGGDSHCFTSEYDGGTKTLTLRIAGEFVEPITISASADGYEDLALTARVVGR